MNPLPKIGKNVIETLTLGMYEDSRFIYREYIQNSADQIDVAIEQKILESRREGNIFINIDPKKRMISVEDNATGIKHENIRRFLSDVANSEKDLSKRKGFRGIGRLGGLGYCKKLVFETSYKGETQKNMMILNAELLRTIISNRKDQTDAASVISIITTIETSKAAINDHFFKVTLEGVIDNNDTILDENSVREYLSMVAPVEFSKQFTYKKKIKDYLKSRHIILDEYNVNLNGKPVYKAYKDTFNTPDENRKADIISIGFFDVTDAQSKLLAIGWYGISSRLNEVINKLNIERGIRIRKHNIAIGNEETLFKRFKADRTNLRYVGEIHVLGEGFIPNARRDYFNANSTVEQFENALNKIFSDFESRLPHRASDLHNRLKTILHYKTIYNRYKKDKPKFKTATEQEQRLLEVLHSFEAAKRAQTKIAKIEKEINTSPQLEALFDSIISEHNWTVDEPEIEDLKIKKVYPPLTFSKVSQEQQSILNEVIVFLQEELGHKVADPIIRKIQKRYN